MPPTKRHFQSECNSLQLGHFILLLIGFTLLSPSNSSSSQTKSLKLIDISSRSSSGGSRESSGSVASSRSYSWQVEATTTSNGNSQKHLSFVPVELLSALNQPLLQPAYLQPSSGIGLNSSQEMFANGTKFRDLQESRHRRIQRSTPSGGQQAVNVIRGLTGQRLAIPCSNFSLTDLALPALMSATGQSQSHSRTGSVRVGPNNRLRAGSQSTNLRPANPAAAISLIVWHKDDQLDSPIFAVDARGASSWREAKQQTGSEPLTGRLHLEEAPVKPDGRGMAPALVIDEATMQDVGVYTCTVEFHKAPTQMHRTRIELITPPKDINLRDETFGKRITNGGGLIGPYDEDSSLSLTCQVEITDPPTSVSWWQLTSVSNVQPSSLQASSSSSSSSKAVASSSLKLTDNKANYLTTLQIGKQEYLNDLNENENKIINQQQDYFVAIHSSIQEQHSMLIPSLATEGNRLRYWSRIEQQNTRFNEANLQLNLARSSLGDEYLCLAYNNDFAPPLNSSIKINMNLKPTEVRIMNKHNLQLKIGEKSIIECQVYGSKPSAKISWLRGAHELDLSSIRKSTNFISGHQELDGLEISETNRDIRSSGLNITKISYLSLVPQLSDNQQILTCSAFNPKMPNVPPLIDSFVMNVHYAAQVKLQLGTNLKLDSIELGSDVFMDCILNANPPIDDLSWLFNDQPLISNVTSGVIMSGQTLVLQRIRIEHRGNYQCVATNSMGKSYSNKIELKPRFKPICDYSKTKNKYEIQLNQATRIECNVLAEPVDDLQFSWKRNQSLRGLQDGDEDSLLLDDIKQYETNFTQSFVMFTPRTKRHYGTFLCSATNSMGKQETPCIIHVIPSELPRPVFSCFFENITSDSFNVHCQTPYSSASKQSYLLELYTNDSIPSGDTIKPPIITSTNSIHSKWQRQEDSINDGNGRENNNNDENDDDDNDPDEQQVRKIRSETPSFSLTNLESDRNYTVVIYVQNSRGRSTPVTYQQQTSISNGAQLTSGRVELYSGSRFQRPGEPSSLSDKLISYLRVNDYLINGNSKPIVGIALVVLLCTITIVTLAFFIGRICRPSNGDNRGVNGNRKSRIYQSKCADLRGEKLKTYDKRDPQTETSNNQLAPTAAAANQASRLQGGSGSDTSRETNTDSTLVSSSRTGCLQSLGTRLQLDNCRESLFRQDNTPFKGSSSAVRGSLQDGLYSTTRSIPSPLLMSGSQLYGNHHHHNHDQQQSIGNVKALYSSSSMNRKQQVATNNTNHNSVDNSNTPQVSLRSESDCTSNAGLQPDTSECHDQGLIIECTDTPNEQSIYVINGSLNGPQNLDHHHPLRLINSNQFWPYNETVDNCNSLSGGTQVSSSLTADSLDRRLTRNPINTSYASYNNQRAQIIQDQTGQNISQGPPVPMSFLPNSVSIPVSLDDCVHFETSRQRRFSQDFIPNERVCSQNEPYLILASPAPTNKMDYHNTRVQSFNHQCNGDCALNEQLVAPITTLPHSRRHQQQLD